MRLGIDLDEVLVDFEGSSRFLLEEEFGLRVPKPSTYWEFAKDYCADQGMPEAWDWLWDEGVKRGLFRKAHLLRGGFRFVHTLAKQGHHLVAITKRPKTARADTYAWLGFHEMPFDEVHVLGPSVSKTTVQPLCDLYLDDGPANVHDVLTDTGRWAVLLDQPWNQEYEPPLLAEARFRRAYTWDDVYQAIKECETSARAGTR